VLIGLVVEAGQLRQVCGAGILAGHVGELLPLDGSLSGETIRAGETLITGDTERDPRVDLGATRAYGVRSAVCVPLMRGGERVGVLTVGSAGPGAFEQHDVLLLSSLADFMSAVIGAALDFTTITARLLAERQAGSRRGVPVDTGDAALAERFVENVLDPSGAKEHSIRSRVKRILEGPGFSLVFQPTFELEGGGLFCTEALARFGDEPDEPPDIVIAAAHQVGLGVELEAAIIELAAAQLGQRPGWGLLAVNAGPGALASSRVAEALARSDPERIIVELTEHVRVDDYARLADAARALRHMGVRLAIDDAGAGFASLRHILRLEPDFIKLDRTLIHGIERDRSRQALAAGLISFAEKIEATIVAEGIERAAEIEALVALGVSCGQGFFLARPKPLPRRNGSGAPAPEDALRYEMSPSRRARATACVRFRTRSRTTALCTCVRTVSGERKSFAPISSFVKPSESRRRISRSRLVSPGWLLSSVAIAPPRSGSRYIPPAATSDTARAMSMSGESFRTTPFAPASSAWCATPAFA